MIPVQSQFNKTAQMIDLASIPFVPLDDAAKSNFTNLLRLRLIQHINNFNLLCGISLNSESLCNFSVKENTYKTLSFILDNLASSKLDLNEIDLTKRKILIGLDQATVSFSVAIEFSKFTTTISIISDPGIPENQSTFHVKSKIVETITLTSIFRAFVSIARKTPNEYDIITIEGNSIIGNHIFHDELSEFKRIYPNLKTMFIKLDKDPLIKNEQAKYIFNRFNRTFDDTLILSDYNTVKVEYTGMQAMFGPHLETIKYTSRIVAPFP